MLTDSVGAWMMIICFLGALAHFIAPVIFFFNLYYCLAVIPREDKASVFAGACSWVSFVVFTVLGGIAFTIWLVPRVRGPVRVVLGRLETFDAAAELGGLSGLPRLEVTPVEEEDNDGKSSGQCSCS